LLVGASLALAGWPAAGRAQEPAPTPTAEAAAAQEPSPPETTPAPEPTLQQQIDDLQQQLLVLQRKAEIAAEAEADKAETGATVTANAKDGFSLKSNDGNFTLRLRGYLQLDGRSFGNDPQDKSIDTFLIRRARPIFEGTIYKRFGFRLMPDFGTGATLLQDAYLEWTFTPAAVLRAGKLKPPVGLERLQSASEITFVERALPTGLVPNRDLGIQLGGQLAAGRLEYAVGVFNGVVDGGNVDPDTNDAKDVAARLWASPWKATPSALSGLSFGLAATRGNQKGTLTAPALAAYRTAGQQTFFAYRADGTAAGTVLADGERFRLSPQAAFYGGPLGVLAEYVRGRSDVRRGTTRATLDNTAWQVTALWVLTGENASFRWHAPKRGFDPTNTDAEKRGHGAFALTARYNAFAADEKSFPTFASSSSAQEAKGWAVGVDWTLQRLVRWLINYEVTTFGGRGPARDDEKVLFTRFQLGW
jgi:phosphate-selective porin OprO/OprP